MNDRHSIDSDASFHGKRRISFRDSTLYGRGSMEHGREEHYFQYFLEDEEITKRPRFSLVGRASVSSAPSSSPSAENRIALAESNRELGVTSSSPPPRDVVWETAMTRQAHYHMRTMNEAQARLNDLPDRLERILSGGSSIKRSSASSEVRDSTINR